MRRAAANFKDSRVQIAHHCARTAKEELARFRQAHPARRAMEERGPELFLEELDLAADRGLGDPQLRRGPAQVTGFGDGDERFELREAHVRDVAQTRPNGRPRAS